MKKKQCIMSEEAREQRRKYYKAWRAANRDKTRAAQERYWLKKAREAEEAAAMQQTAEQGAAPQDPEDSPEQLPTGRTLTAQGGAQTIDLDNMTEERLKALAELRRMETEGATV